MKPGVLIPRRRQPFGRDRGRDTAAGHETEIPRSGCRDQTGIRRGGQVFDDYLRIPRLLRQRPAKRLNEFAECSGGKNRTRVDARQKGLGELTRPVQGSTHWFVSSMHADRQSWRADELTLRARPAAPSA